MILCNNFTEGGSKSVDVKHKMLAIKCSWKQRLYNENSHEWKLIPLRYIKAFGKKFKFHPNLHISSQPNLRVLKLCDALCDLVPFVQFKKREKYPWRIVAFSKVAA